MYLEETFAWHKGCEVHSLSPAIPDHEENRNEDETPQQTDADVIKHDLIKVTTMYYHLCSIKNNCASP